MSTNNSENKTTNPDPLKLLKYKDNILHDLGTILQFPIRAILIHYMIYCNRDLTTIKEMAKQFNINQKTLEYNLNILMNAEFVYRKNKNYFVTTKGYQYMNKIESIVNNIEFENTTFR